MGAAGSISNESDDDDDATERDCCRSLSPPPPELIAVVKATEVGVPLSLLLLLLLLLPLATMEVKSSTTRVPVDENTFIVVVLSSSFVAFVVAVCGPAKKDWQCNPLFLLLLQHNQGSW